MGQNGLITKDLLQRSKYATEHATSVHAMTACGLSVVVYQRAKPNGIDVSGLIDPVAMFFFLKN